MAEQKNLTEENVDDLTKHLEKMKQTNPDLEYRFFEQDEKQKKEPTNEQLLDKLESIERRLQDIKRDIND